MKVEVTNVQDILTHFKEYFPLTVSYINKDKMYTYDWLHFISNDNTNDAFLYVLPNCSHNVSDSLWIYVFEVRLKGKGFGSQVIEKLKLYAKNLGFKSISLTALNTKAKMFYLKNGFVDNGKYEVFSL